MDHREHEGDVGAGGDRPPRDVPGGRGPGGDGPGRLFAGDEARRRRDAVPVPDAREVVAQGAHADESCAAFPEAVEAARRRVITRAAGVDPRVLHGDPTERDEELGLLGEDVPRRRRLGEDALVGEDPGEDDLRGAGGVGVDAAGVTAGHGEEAVQLTLRVVEPPGAGPPVGAAVDRLGAVLGVHATHLVGESVEHLVPRRRHPVLRSDGVAASGVGAGSTLPPASTHGGAGDPGASRHRPGDVAEKG